ncbi:MAG: hypothetical protein ABFD79_10670 [Phycisphaerales bacterium]
MNKMQSLAKTVITLFCIYWLIALILGMFHFVFFTLQTRTKVMNIGMILVALVYIIIILVVIGVLQKRNSLALKIANDDELKEVDVQIKWIPFTYRLVSVIAGLFFLFKAATYLQRIGISRFSSESGIFEITLTIIILIAAGIYFLCGAPHFVRWQIKKTLQLCTKNNF